MRVDRFIRITKGLDIKLKGSPQLIRTAYTSPKVAITPPDFKWITPQLIIEEGATVRVGDSLLLRENPKSVSSLLQAEQLLKWIGVKKKNYSCNY